MSDPLALVSFAIAARDGVIDGWPVRQLVSAGVGLLRRSAPLVRALSAKRAAILLPPSPLMFTAFAASEGRGALLLDPSDSLSDRAELQRAGIGAAFTLDRLQGVLPADLPRVLLDDAPHRARYIDPHRSVDVDLAMHEGLPLEGDPDAKGSNEEMLLASAGDGVFRSLSHRQVLDRARATISSLALDTTDHVLVVRAAGDVDALPCGEVAALLAGARVTTAEAPSDALTHIGRLDISLVVGRAATLESLLVEVAASSPDTAVRAMASVGAQLPHAARARWAAATGRDVPWFPLA